MTEVRRPSVVVLDYGSGNVHSAVKALTSAGAAVTLTNDAATVSMADGLLVPGVGAFDAVMQQLRSVNGPALVQERLQRGAPVLGVCVGLQIMFDVGTEHEVSSNGLGYFRGKIGKLQAKRLPHMGWNTVTVPNGSVLFDGIENERFYFVHSYGADAALPHNDAHVTKAEHLGAEFIAAIEQGPLSATQFHPEKSGAAGLKLLRNWLDSLAGSTPANDHRTV
ncbi:MAG: imidazole glycerol phosphate synthase subunit HisH [Canibacter sp.]